MQQVVAGSYLRQVGQQLEYMRADIVRRISEHMRFNSVPVFHNLPPTARYTEVLQSARTELLARGSQAEHLQPAVPTVGEGPSQGEERGRQMEDFRKRKERDQVGWAGFRLCISDFWRKVHGEVPTSQAGSAFAGMQPPQAPPMQGEGKQPTLEPSWLAKQLHVGKIPAYRLAIAIPHNRAVR